MYVFVSWAYTTVAEEAEVTRLGWVEKGKKSKDTADKQFAESLTQVACLPEYHAYLQVKDKAVKQDVLNHNLLAIRFVVPALAKIVTYQLAKRIPGDGKLSVSLAARTFLLNTFAGAWTGDLQAAGKVILVGMPGLKEFFRQLALACGALNQPLPVDLWLSAQQLELCSRAEVCQLMDACSFSQSNVESAAQYTALTAGWLGIGASAERDSSLLLATASKLGFKGV